MDASKFEGFLNKMLPENPFKYQNINIYIYISISHRPLYLQSILIVGWLGSSPISEYKRTIVSVPMVMIYMLSLLSSFARLILDLSTCLFYPSRLHVYPCARDIQPLLLPPPLCQTFPWAFLCLQAEVHNGISSNVMGHHILLPGKVGIQFLQTHQYCCALHRKVVTTAIRSSLGGLPWYSFLHPMVEPPQCFYHTEVTTYISERNRIIYCTKSK